MFKKPLTYILLLGLALAAVLGWYLHGHTVEILQPQGTIAHQQRNLMLFAVGLAATVVLPVFGFAIFVAVRYREDKNQDDYQPEWHGHWGLSFGWWLAMATVIAILAVVMWKTTHQLDPYKTITAAAKPMTIQVVALQWKWLFIYPDQHIATVNQVFFPEKTPVTFDLTADAPMNSFWIPQLGGQTYAMPGMVNKLNLMADHTGNFAGSDAEISGAGFATMRFTAHSVSSADFGQWVTSAQHSKQSLNQTTYASLAKPSESAPPAVYVSADPRLYDSIVMKYMAPTPQPTAANPTTMPGMDKSMDMSGME